MADWAVGVGNCGDLLKKLPANSIHCCVTSPPYFNLRDYQTSPVLWGGDPHCTHDWGEPEAPQCWFCGAWRGELGREYKPELYVEHLVSIFHEVKRVLHPTGTLWVNLGDGYAGSGKGPSGISSQTGNQASNLGPALLPPGYKPKDLYGVPWLLGRELQKDGWYWRSTIIWHKPNVKPGSYQDRPVDDYEPVLLLAKSNRYYYDAFAGREPSADGESTRSLRTVWSIPTRSSGYPHFATFPPELPRKCITLGCPKYVCDQCGEPFERVVEISRPEQGNDREGAQQRLRSQGAQSGGYEHVTLGLTDQIKRKSRGFKRMCACTGGHVPGRVIDIFGGLMTTGVEALKLDRRFIGLEANPEFANEGRRRLDALRKNC